MSTQREAAMAAMVEWLSHPQELGKAPAKIEHAGEFERHGMRYYMFKYKKSMFGFTWLLGVCGGYEGDETEHCGHVFSEMEAYDPATAEEKSLAMVEMIREHWAREAERAMAENGEDAPDETGGGPFLCFVLLGSGEWDAGRFRQDLESEWGIPVPEDAAAREDGEEGDGGEDGDPSSLVWEVDGMLASVAFIDAPVPDGEAERAAARNWMWDEAGDTAAAHKAQLLVAVLPRGRNPVDAGCLLVKLASACLRQENALGAYTSGTVFEPGFYRESAAVMRDGELPYLNWVFFGVARSDAGYSLYTDGLRAFGKDEMEVLDSTADPNEVRDLLFNVAAYVISENVTLRAGETLGSSEDERLPVTRSEGVFLDGLTLKIGMKPAGDPAPGSASGKKNPW